MNIFALFSNFLNLRQIVFFVWGEFRFQSIILNHGKLIENEILPTKKIHRESKFLARDLEHDSRQDSR